MSSNIEVQRICEHCGTEFTARTTVTRFCSHRCSQIAYKKRTRDKKIKKSNTDVQQIKNQPIEELKAKEFLKVREVAQLLNCSIRSVYYYIESGTIKAVNIGQRMTRVKRVEIDKLFEQPEPTIKQPEQIDFEISDCYTIGEVLEKYSISGTTLQNLIKRESIPKIQKGWYVYVPKTLIDQILS